MSALALGLRLNAARGQRSLMARAISAIRRLGGTALYVPDDYGLVLGPELVTNGDFSAGLTGWTNSSTGTGTATVSGGQLSLYRLNSSNAGQVLQSIGSAGKAHRVSFTIVSGTAFVSLAGAGGNYPAGTYTFAWIPEGSGFYVVNPSDGTTTTIDNISVREILSATSFIDSTGTQPVTAVGDLVGLLTDRSYGAGNLGAELVTNGDFSAGTTGWSKVFAGSISVSSGVLRVTNNDGTGSDQEKAFTVVSTVAGRTYALSTQLITLSGGPGSILVRDGSNSESGSVIVSDSSLSVGNKRFVFVAQSSSTTVQVRLSANFANGYSEWDNISVRKVLGNHATQPTTASKPLVTRVPKRLGPNLVVNGTGDSTAGWFLQDGVLSTSGGEFVITANGGLYTNAGQPVSVTAGRSYQVTTKIRRGTSNYASLQLENGGAYPEFGNAGTTTGVQTLVVVAATSTFSVRIWLAQQANGATAFFDDVEVREVLEWSNALDFDGNDHMTIGGAPFQITEDHFVVCAFVSRSGGATNKTFFAVSNGIPRAAGLSINGSNVFAQWVDSALTVRSFSAPVVHGQPYVISARVRSGVADVRLNGVSLGSVAVPTNPTTLNACLIGNLSVGGAEPFLGSVIDLAYGKSTVSDADLEVIEMNMTRRARAQYAVSTPTLSLDFTTGAYSVSDGEI